MMLRPLTVATAGLAVSVLTLTTAATGASGAPDRILERNLTGAAAVDALDGRLAEVARLNDRTPAELTELLEGDATMWLDRSGRLHVKDPLPDRPATVAAGAESVAEPGPYPNSQTFGLHSRPGANRVIYLDFNGHSVSGTAWNAFYGIPTSAQPALDLNGDPTGWSQAEHDLIQSVYQRVAEDFAPFNVDVTTEDPGAAALDRSGSTDGEFGTRVLITPSTDAAGRICGNACGGVAYVGIYNAGGSSYYHPAWVFPHLLGNNAKYIAEAATHEAGHNLGLDHDGTSTEGYYGGHYNWAPIMGVGYYEPVVQWSRGEYTGANNTQDDFAVMQSYGLPLRADDHGDGTGTATALGGAAGDLGVIETRADVDVFSITRQCDSSPTLRVRPVGESPNLDAKLRLLTSSGTLVAEDDPGSGESSYDVATGMSASVTASLAAGTYYLEVQGVGTRTPSTGYSDYASVGQYELSVPGCATDSIAPTVTGRTPAPGATGVGRAKNVTATFSEPVAGVNGTTFVLRKASTGTKVPATVTLGSTPNRWVLNPKKGLAARSKYTVVLKGGLTRIRDLSDNPLVTKKWSFRTGG